MPHEVRIAENSDWFEVETWGGLDAPRVDPNLAQRHIKQKMKTYLEALLQEQLNWEAEEQLCAARFERSVPGRRDYRNGYYTRDVGTTLGTIRLRVPRARHLGLNFSLFEAYKRRWRDVDALLLEAYIGGMSATRVAGRLAPLLGIDCSRATVAGLKKHLEETLRSYRSAPLEDKYVGADSRRDVFKG